MNVMIVGFIYLFFFSKNSNNLILVLKMNMLIFPVMFEACTAKSNHCWWLKQRD